MRFCGKCVLMKIRNVMHKYVLHHGISCQKLEEIGQIDLCKSDSKYFLSGQLFINKLVAYRGVIICPWKAKVFNKSCNGNTPSTELYYQVLIDNRDYPYIRIHNNCDRIANLDSRLLLFTHMALDYVSHKDLIPYKPTNVIPIEHRLFDKLFHVKMFENSNNTSTIKILPHNKLKEWRRKYLPSLQQTSIHKVIKDDICISAMSFYMGKGYRCHWWYIRVEIANLGKETVVLQGQEFGIYDQQFANSNFVNDDTFEIPLKIKDCCYLRHNTVLTPKSPVIQFINCINLYKSNGSVCCQYRIIKQPNLEVQSFIQYLSLESRVHQTA